MRRSFAPSLRRSESSTANSCSGRSRKGVTKKWPDAFSVMAMTVVIDGRFGRKQPIHRSSLQRP